MSKKEQILKLRAEGKTYDEIVKIVNCSKGTVAYHCGVGQKEKAKNRKIKLGWKKRFGNKVYNFLSNIQYNKRKKSNKTWKVKLKLKIETYLMSKDGTYNRMNKEINTKTVLQHFGNNPKCYLTGRIMDITETNKYHFDHIIPRSKGGDNTLSNMGIACKEANEAKRDMHLADFIQLCKEVLEEQGYSVNKL